MNKALKKIISLLSFIVCMQDNMAQQVIPLYPGPVPNSTGAPDRESDQPDRIRWVSKPTLTLFRALTRRGNTGKASVANAPQRAVIVCPGGGYGSLVMEREGYRLGKAFAEKGITAFVLKYRLPDSTIIHDMTIGPLQDAQQAIKTIRSRAKEFHIDPGQVGIMGFSAGGHLAASLGTMYEPALIENGSGTSLRPDFLMLVYPVISFVDTVQAGSMHNLLGPAPSAELRYTYSTELHVNGQTPPTFITVAADDQGIYPGCMLFFEALRKNGVPSELHIYAKGNHGYLKYPPLEEWFGRCMNWLNNL